MSSTTTSTTTSTAPAITLSIGRSTAAAAPLSIASSTTPSATASTVPSITSSITSSTPTLHPPLPLSASAAEIIRRKKLRYCRWADSNQWDLFDQIALPDATFAFHSADGALMSQAGVDYAFDSRDSFVAYFRDAFRSLETIHLVDGGDLEQISPDEVRAVWTVIYHAGVRGGADAHETGGGHYHETWVRRGDDWFMRDLKLDRLYWKPSSGYVEVRDCKV